MARSVTNQMSPGRRRQVAQRRRRFGQTLGIGATGGMLAGMTNFGLRRGLYHYKKIRAGQPVVAAGKIAKPATRRAVRHTLNMGTKRAVRVGRIRSAVHRFAPTFTKMARVFA